MLWRTTPAYSSLTLSVDSPSHHRQLALDQTLSSLSPPQNLSMPIAAIDTLASLISSSSSSTIQELISLLESASTALERASFNPISLASGTKLFMRFVTIQRLSPDQDFGQFKKDLVQRAREFVDGSGRARDRIASSMQPFIQDDKVSAMRYAVSYTLACTCICSALSQRLTELSPIADDPCALVLGPFGRFARGSAPTQG